MWAPLLIVALLPAVSPFLLYGCSYAQVDLCEGDESCYPDGLFGQCYSPASGAPEPTRIGKLDDEQLELLTLELTRLAKNDQDWTDSRTQCVLAYYKLSMAYSLQYDPEFCNVKHPTNIWALIQLIDIGLNENAEDSEALARNNYELDGPVETEVLQVIPLADDDDSAEEDIAELLQQINEPPPEIEAEDVVLPETEESDPLVDGYIQDIVAGETPDLSKLSDEQLNDLLARLFQLKKNLDVVAPAVVIPEIDSDGEAEEVVPLDEAAMADEQMVLKKDAEQVGNVNLGLENTEHKIVKGRNGVSRVVGNRVYLKVNLKEVDQLANLEEFLVNHIAIPNDLLFDDFHFENGQLSMRISRLPSTVKPKIEKRMSVEGVAQAVYKRRKDIAHEIGADIAETGIGIGDESVPVESADRDWLFQPVLFICAFTIVALLSVLGAHFYRSRHHRPSDLAQMVEGIDGKTPLAYQELCRQRVGETSPRSKSSSTSSWCGDETEKPAIDISTGHVVLTFLQEFLAEPTKIEAQWDSLKEYRNHQKNTTIASRFIVHNRECLPFDENLVTIDSWKEGEQAYINASFIYDDDPRQAVYISGQNPRGDEIAAFWQAVWQHGVCLIVNLSTLEENKAEKSYWPETGSQVFGPFEIHLVSEHIWSDDYLVRSFYLKNLQNGETRTITQFHYLSWKKDSTPPSAKSLLEFRRKVNKSYRGRSSPVLVHSWDGIGRAGVYCAVDLLCARLLRGVRQIDVAASVEHLRDQRDGMVRNGDQFKLIYACLAQEVSALIKSASN